MGFNPQSLAEAAFGDDYRAFVDTLSQIETKARDVLTKWRHANGFGQTRRGKPGITDKSARDLIAAGLAVHRSQSKA